MIFATGTNMTLSMKPWTGESHDQRRQVPTEKLSTFLTEFNQSANVKMSFDRALIAHIRQIQSLCHNALGLKLLLSVFSPNYT